MSRRKEGTRGPAVLDTPRRGVWNFRPAPGSPRVSIACASFATALPAGRRKALILIAAERMRAIDVW